MSAIIVLILRILLVASLYAFLFTAIFKIWKETTDSSSSEFEKTATPIQFKFVEDLKEYTFTKPDIILGREAENDMALPDETVSAVHARVYHRDSQWLIEDANSTNGTFLNGQRVFTATVLVSGDIITCGAISIEVIIPEKKTG